MKYEIVLIFDENIGVHLKTYKDLEYIPDHFIFEGDVYTVTDTNGKRITAKVSTPLAVTLKRE